MNVGVSKKVCRGLQIGRVGTIGWTLFSTLFLLALPPATFPQSFSITRSYMAGDGFPRVEFTGRDDSYYILYRGADVLQIVLPWDVKLGSNGLVEVADLTTQATEGGLGQIQFYTLSQTHLAGATHLVRFAAYRLEMKKREGI